MTRAAAENRLDPIVGREKEIERLAQILSRRKKNNPVLIGEPGVGKSAIAEGLAIRIIQKKVSRVLFDKRSEERRVGKAFRMRVAEKMMKDSNSRQATINTPQ